jgi:predicted ArsR family transcriptional regulator
MKQTVQPTSKAAYDSLKPEMLREDYRLILFALKNIKEGTSQEISASLKLPDDKIRKRLSELAKMGLIYKPGHTHVTKSGNKAYVWRLVEGNEPVQQPKILPGKPVHEYAKAIKSIGQASLF